jgi:hypothetical protein
MIVLCSVCLTNLTIEEINTWTKLCVLSMHYGLCMQLDETELTTYRDFIRSLEIKGYIRTMDSSPHVILKVMGLMSDGRTFCVCKK